MKTTQKKQTKAEVLAKPRQAAIKKNKPKAKAGKFDFIKNINPIYLAIGGLVFVLLLGLMFYLMAGTSAPQPAPVETSSSIDEFQQEAEIEPVYPSDHFMSSETPIQTLADQAANTAIREYPGYRPGQGITLATGDTYFEDSPEMAELKDQITTSVMIDLASRTQESVDPSTGQTRLLVKDETTGEFMPIRSEVAAASFEAKANQVAKTKIDTVLTQKESEFAELQEQEANVIQEQPAQPVEKKVVIESVLSDEEKRQYINLIETQERENAKLRDEVEDLNKEIVAQREQVVNILQKIEDSPSATKRLRASMLPENSGLKQKGIVGDRVWFEDKDGSLKTYSIGEIIDGTNLVISGTDEGTGVVLVTPK